VAVYRQVQITFWQDDFVLSLTPEEKFFYLYLMTNSKTTQCGIYELPKRVIQFETGYNTDTVNKLLQRFIEYEKILYCEENKEIMLLNWIKYNWSTSPKVVRCIVKELKAVKTADFVKKYKSLCIEYGYSIDTDPQKEEEKEEKENNKNNIYIIIFDYWNSKKIIVHRKLTDKLKRKINSILKDYTVDEIKKAIDNYHTVLTDERYYWTYKWTLEEFLQRGLERFFTDACFENFKKDKQQPQRGGYKPANSGNFEQRKYDDSYFDNLYKEV